MEWNQHYERPNKAKQIKDRECLCERKRTFFSPRKFRISMERLELVMEALMGKWAYTNLILYRYPLVTPVIRFSTWLSAVRIAAEVFLDPNHASIFSVLFPVVSSFRSWKSRLRCLKLRVSFPRGPSTSITFACTFIFTPSGISIVSEDTIVFISLLLFLRSQHSTPPHNPNPNPSNWYKSRIGWSPYICVCDFGFSDVHFVLEQAHLWAFPIPDSISKL